jgi:hypothetical protein
MNRSGQGQGTILRRKYDVVADDYGQLLVSEERKSSIVSKLSLYLTRFADLRPYVAPKAWQMS